jgi:hypothetical protein
MQDTCRILIDKINAIQTVNTEIIGRIKPTSGDTIEVYNNRLVLVDANGPPQYQLTSEKMQVKGNNTILSSLSDIVAFEILCAWTTNSKLETIWDVFNDKIDYNVTTFEQVVSLNDKMLEVVRKYQLFGESDKAKTELSKFKTNFEVLQTMLGSIESKLLSPNSDIASINQKVDQINKLFKEVSEVCSPVPYTSVLEWEKGNWKIFSRQTKTYFFDQYLDIF